MKKSFICFFILISVNVFAQSVTKTIKVKKEKQPEIIVIRDRPAYFKDSTSFDGAFIYDFIKTNIKIPDSVSLGLIRGVLYVGFTIKETGELKNIHLIKGLKNCGACDKEALRLINSMPKWNAALDLNKPISTDRTLPIPFKAQD